MVTDIFIVFNDVSQVKRVGDEGFTSPTFHFIDAMAKQGQKEAWALKSHWAARMDPFAIAMDGSKGVKAFYSETGEDVIASVINFVKNEQNTSTR